MEKFDMAAKKEIFCIFLFSRKPLEKRILLLQLNVIVFAVAIKNDITLI